MYKGRSMTMLLLLMLFLGGCAMKESLDIDLAAYSDTKISEDAIDTLEYFLQDDPENAWRLEVDMIKAEDPDGFGRLTYIQGKFGSPNHFEVYIITATEIQIRYEVYKTGMIRRFEETRLKGKGEGYIWMRRYMVPGGEGFLTRLDTDHFEFNHLTQEYEWQDVAESAQYISAAWANIEWDSNNQTDLNLDRVLRITAEWHGEGYIMEQYDYAKGAGLVNWRWLDSIEFIQHDSNRVSQDSTGRIRKVAAGYLYAYVEDYGTQEREPVVYEYNLISGEKGRRFDVVKWNSYWRPEKESTWYVVTRDLSKEQVIKKHTNTVQYDYHIPAGSKKMTIADLPYKKTSPPAY